MCIENSTNKVKRENQAEETGNESDSWIEVSAEEDEIDSVSGTSSEEEDSDSESSDDKSTEDDESEKIPQVIIAGETVHDRAMFTYHNEVKVTVKDCLFYDSIEFIFYDAATVNFENCTFSDSKTVTFHENSTLNCQQINCSGPAVYKHYAELHMNFQGCDFFDSKKCTYEKKNTSSETENKPHKSTQCQSNNKQFSELEVFVTNLNAIFKSFCNFIERLLSDDGSELIRLIGFFNNIILPLILICLIGFFCCIIYKKH
ncbi:uncharacterized protein LOC129565188 [Sitodiplosis mosellana]|uniref:uncharacterized protein LOC129565188 n=1 Tax=Sitodiplosis mosellana TaxID=263140 RepID=UPI00244423E8|nr:uncharacterized protein LOC129565188 [Sitodiplosis mosellana]XP_055295730.1 uncharacterized protein LOC129565188 [Sitodiplosis mosellana]XP_055295732.1 uncharacterized protein LOC129565188 [Sitodiplosis mosellana]XP_055295733.1 uncharacterized protein LOC129565188 [Sitodiplosis mosellana]